MFDAFSTTLLVVSLAGYVFLFLKLRQSDARLVDLRDRVERTLAAAERGAAVERTSGGASEEARKTLATAEDARDLIGATRADLAEFRAHALRSLSRLDAAVETLSTQIDSARKASDEAAREMREAASKPSREAAAAADDDEAARRRLRMFP
jgi:hypothetical protein